MAKPSAQVNSDFNMQRITTQEFSNVLRGTIEFGGNVFVAARRGSGKTTMSKDICQEMKMREVYWNLSVFERAEICGYPKLLNTTERSNFVEYLYPYYFRPLMEGDVPCLLILDEVDKAPTELQAPLLEIVQFRTINGVRLPNCQATVMTGNLISEGSQRPSLPLLDRAEKYLMEPSSNQWLDWASKSGEIHPSITAYIADHPDSLFGDSDAGDVYADASPRGWHNASKTVFFGENNRWANSLLSLKVAGYVGKKLGIKYDAYFQHYQVVLPIVEKVMNGERIAGFDKLEPSKQMVCAMVACARTARKVDDNKNKKVLPKEVSHLGKFLDDIDAEIALVSVRSQIGVERVLHHRLDEEPSLDKVLKRINKRIGG